MTATLVKDELTIKVKINKKPFKTSASGKSLQVYSTGGNKEVEVEIDGEKLIIGLNAYIKK